MKNTKLIATLGAVALVAAIGAGSTLAYLTDSTKTVENTFSVGNVTINTPNELKSGLLESKVVNEKGEYVGDTIDKDAETVLGNDYKKLVAGKKLVKDPTFQGLTATSEDAYVFVKVTGLADKAFASVDSKAGDKDSKDLRTVAEGATVKTRNAEWVVKKVTKKANVNDQVILVRKAEGTTKTAKATVFDQVVLVDNLANDQQIGKITAAAYAVQLEGLTEDQAFAETGWNK